MPLFRSVSDSDRKQGIAFTFGGRTWEADDWSLGLDSNCCPPHVLKKHPCNQHLILLICSQCNYSHFTSCKFVIVFTNTLISSHRSAVICHFWWKNKQTENADGAYLLCVCCCCCESVTCFEVSTWVQDCTQTALAIEAGLGKCVW